jgi:hypothetical protein
LLKYDNRMGGMEPEMELTNLRTIS